MKYPTYYQVKNYEISPHKVNHTKILKTPRGCFFEEGIYSIIIFLIFQMVLLFFCSPHRENDN